MALSREKWLLIAALAFLAIGYGILRERTFITEEELTAKINQTLPTGATINDVRTFLNSYRSQFQIDIYDYEEPVPQPDDMVTSTESLATAKGYLVARLYRSGVEPLSLITWNIKMNFYFDNNKKLVGFKLRTIGDGL